MGDGIPAASAEPIPALVRKIENHVKASDEQVIAAARLVRELRRRVDAGEVGDVTWSAWAPKNINLRLSRLRELQRIGAAADPWKELQRQQEILRRRVERHRAEQARHRSPEPERMAVIAWASEAPIDEVRYVRRLIRRKLVAISVSALSPDAQASIH